MEQVNLNKKVYSKPQYEKTIDTKFSQLATTVNINPIADVAGSVDNSAEIDQFFQEYNKLFYSIPKTGETNSHEYLIKKSSEYVGSISMNDDLQALIDEINQLQRQNLELNQQIVSNAISSSQSTSNTM